MIVCLCEGISDKKLRECIRSGATSIDAVSRACGAGTGCGTCVETVAEILATERESACPASTHAGNLLPLAATSS
jgi:bacterioferritin-associated ferredoxin